MHILINRIIKCVYKMRFEVTSIIYTYQCVKTGWEVTQLKLSNCSHSLHSPKFLSTLLPSPLQLLPSPLLPAFSFHLFSPGRLNSLPTESAYFSPTSNVRCCGGRERKQKGDKAHVQLSTIALLYPLWPLSNLPSWYTPSGFPVSYSTGLLGWNSGGAPL